MKLEDVKVGEIVVVNSGPVFKGKEGRVIAVANGAVTLRGKFSHNRFQNRVERAFHPDYLSPLGDAWKALNSYDPGRGESGRYGGADVTS
jgi:hypothetical protein